MDDPTKNEMSDLLDQVMLDYLKHGEPVLDKDGKPVIENGRIVRKRTASMMNAIRQRLKDAGVAAAPTQTNPIGQALQEIQKKPRTQWSFAGRPVGAVPPPPVDTEEDDAATA